MAQFLLIFFSFSWLKRLDFLAPLLLRLYLAPIFWVLGSAKIGLFYKPNAEIDFFNPATWIETSFITATTRQFSDFSLGLSSETLVILIATIEILAAILLMLGFFVRWVSLPLMAVVALGVFMVLGGNSLDTLEDFVMTHGNTTIDIFEAMLVHFIMLISLFFLGAGRYISFDWFIQNHYFKKVEARLIIKPEITEVKSEFKPKSESKPKLEPKPEKTITVPKNMPILISKTESKTKSE